MRNVTRFVNRPGRSNRSSRSSRHTLLAAAAVAVFGTASARATVVINPIAPGDVPISNPPSVFDVSNAGNTYSLGPNTNLNPGGFDTRDLFGGSFGTYGYESNALLFADNQPIGTVETVNVTLASPTSLGSFNLFLEDDGANGNRSASEFLLYGDGTLIDDIPILDTTGTESYTGVYGSNSIEISDSFTGLPADSNYTLEFIQNQDSNGTSGIRALDFQGSAALSSPTAGGPGGPGGPGGSVPEPRTALLGILISGVTLLGRRRRRRAPA